MAPQSSREDKVTAYWPVLTGLLGLGAGAVLMAFNLGGDRSTAVARIEQIEKRTEALESAFARIETKVNATNDNVSYMLGLMKSPRELADAGGRGGISRP